MLKIILIGIISTILISNVLSLGILSFTDTKITKAYFTPYYYAKITSNEYDVNIFKDYMRQKGWDSWERMGGLIRFHKGEKTFEITNKQIKTVIIDGKPVFTK